MNGDDDARLEDFFLQFILENSKELEEIVEVKFDGFWNIKQENSERLMATGTGNDGQSDINIYVNLGNREEAFVRKIQDLIARANDEEDNYILCIGRKFDSADIEELMQDVIFYIEKCVHLIFLTVDFKEDEEMNLKDTIKEQVAIKVYKKTY